MKVVAEAGVAQAMSEAALPELSPVERLLLSLVPAGGRVAVLKVSPTVERALRAASCEVLDLGASTSGELALDALERFAPAKLLLPDAGQCGIHLTATLRAIGRAAPGAEVLVGFWNGSGSEALLASLIGRALDRATIPDEAVRRSLFESGYSIGAREVWADEVAPLSFTEDVDRALRQLFLQLNPAAKDTWVVYTGRRSVTPADAPHRLVPGLLSVIVRNHTIERLQLLDQTIFSLACQSYRPLEVVIASQSREPEAVHKLTTILERHRHVVDYAFQVVSEPSANDIRGRLLNLGVAAARGQYIAFLDDDDVVYPHHYRRLIAALQGGTAAWSVSRTRTARFTFDASGALYCKSKSHLSGHEQFSLPDLVRDNYIAAHAYVLDRMRLGRFRVGFSEEVSRTEDYVFLLRLAACFRPVFLPDEPSCEYRVRDDGSNSNMMAEQPEEIRARERIAWASAHQAREALKRPLQMLLTMGEYEDHLRLAAGGEISKVLGVPHGPPPLRYRIADRINAIIKRAVPGAHGRLKRLAGSR